MDIVTVAPDLFLEPMDLQHAKTIFETVDKERTYLREWLPFVDETETVDDTNNFVEWALNTPEEQLVMVMMHQDEFAGLISLKDIDKANRKCEIGYWLSQQKQGKGIVTRSITRMLEYAFDELELNRVQIKVAVKNIKSNQVPQRMSFRLEGVQREGELLVSGEYADLNIYSMLKKEFIRTL